MQTKPEPATLETPETMAERLCANHTPREVAEHAASIREDRRAIAAWCELEAQAIHNDESWSPGDSKAGEMAAYRRIAALLGGVRLDGARSDGHVFVDRGDRLKSCACGALVPDGNECRLARAGGAS